MRPPPDERGLRPWVRLASSLGLRAGLGPSGAGVLSAGLARGRIGAGVGAGLGTRTPIPAAGAQRGYTAVPLVFGCLLDARPVLLGAQIGAEHRRFLDGTTVVQAGFMPFARAEVALDLGLGGRVHLEPGLALRVDLGDTEIRRDGAAVLQLPRSTFQAALGVRWR